MGKSFIKGLVSTLGDEKLFVDSLSMYMSNIEQNDGSIKTALNQEIFKALKSHDNLTNYNLSETPALNPKNPTKTYI